MVTDKLKYHVRRQRIFLHILPNLLPYHLKVNQQLLNETIDPKLSIIIRNFKQDWCNLQPQVICLPLHMNLQFGVKHLGESISKNLIWKLKQFLIVNFQIGRKCSLAQNQQIMHNILNKLLVEICRFVFLKILQGIELSLQILMDRYHHLLFHDILDVHQPIPQKHSQSYVTLLPNFLV